MLKYHIEIPKILRTTNPALVPPVLIPPALVIGLPGLVGLNEDNRVKRMLAELREEGYHTLLFDYADIEKKEDGKLLECRPDLSGSEITRIIADVIKNRGIKLDRTALIANSISAIPATRHLMIAFPELPAIYASISPLPGWPYFLTPEARKPFEEARADISVSTQLDKQLGITRIIPRDFVPKLMKIDCLEELRLSQYQPDGNMAVVTLIGKQDNVVSPDAMIRYHEALGGTAQTLTRIDSGHDVPGTNHYITDAIKTRLPLR